MTGAVVLAAGQSRRMGAPKLVLPWRRTTVLGSVLDALLGAGIDEVRVVIRAGDATIRAAIEGRPVRMIENPCPESDMLDSVRRGLGALPPECDPILVTPADLPGLGSPLIMAMRRAFEAGVVGCAPGIVSQDRWPRRRRDRASADAQETPRATGSGRAPLRDRPFSVSERSILVPVHRGRRGHPLIFAAAHRDEVLSCFDGVGLCGLLRAHPGRVVEWPAPDASVLEDLDTPEDYRRAQGG